MPVLSIVQSAATQLGIEVPSQVFSAPTSNRAMVNMRSVLNKAARQIAREYDWSVLRDIHEITGGGDAFPLPGDYDRMTRDADLFGSEWSGRRRMSRINSLNEWMAIKGRSTWSDSDGYWTIYGNRIHVLPGASGPFSFPYITKNIVAASGGAAKPSFTNDSDSFIVSEPLLELAVIWNWRSLNGDDYAEDMANYQARLVQEVAADRGNGVVANEGWGGMRARRAYSNVAPRVW